MEQPNTEHPYFEEHDGPAEALPIFVTRTTLGSILNRIGVETLMDLGAHSSAFPSNASPVSDTPFTE
ncbi:MAG: hypothetical protein ABIO21_19240 [Pseudomonas sp.]